MAPESTRTVLVIMGMRDNASREHVVEVLETVDGVKEAYVNLYRGQATIVHECRCELGDLVQAVLRAGYGAALLETAGGHKSLARQGDSDGAEVRRA